MVSEADIERLSQQQQLQLVACILLVDVVAVAACGDGGNVAASRVYTYRTYD